MSGILPREFDPAAIARSYGAGGAACLPVLTGRDFFQGAHAHLAAARGNGPILKPRRQPYYS